MKDLFAVASISVVTQKLVNKIFQSTMSMQTRGVYPLGERVDFAPKCAYYAMLRCQKTTCYAPHCTHKLPIMLKFMKGIVIGKKNFLYQVVELKRETVVSEVTELQPCSLVQFLHHYNYCQRLIFVLIRCDAEQVTINSLYLKMSFQ